MGGVRFTRCSQFLWCRSGVSAWVVPIVWCCLFALSFESLSSSFDAEVQHSEHEDRNRIRSAPGRATLFQAGILRVSQSSKTDA